MKKNTWCNAAVFLVLLTAALLPAAKAEAAGRVALVIGNGNYGAKSLATSRRDAEDFSNSLRKLEFDDVRYLEDGSLDQMRQSLQSFATRAEHADTVLFYFAGHGIQVSDQNYLIPAKTSLSRIQDVPTATMALSEVFQVYWHLPATVKLVILDACRNNPFKRAGDESSGWVDGLAKPANVPSGTMTFFATEYGKTSLDGSTLHSPFTAALIYNITEPGLEYRSFFTEVRKFVRLRTDDAQTPWEEGAPLKGFYFRAPAEIVGKAVKGDDEVLVLVNGEEVMSWNSGHDTPRHIFLKPGANDLVIKVFNQSTYTGACNWLRAFKKDCEEGRRLPFECNWIWTGLKNLGFQVDKIQEPEGWNYRVEFYDKDQTVQFKSFEDGESTVEEKGPRHGKMFTVARATIFVNRESGKISFQNPDSQAWRH
jgi:hypothetical protein